MKVEKGVKITILFLIVSGLLFFWYKEVEGEKRQQRIAKEIIRLHVIANSDSKEDQSLKLKIKEKVVVYLRKAMGEAETVEEAREKIREKLPEICQVAEERVRREGYDYEVTAELGNCYFPVKEYGDFTFPAGEYEALRIKIGKSKGRNWWCVMYPTLCFVDSVYQVVPEESKEKLRTSLTNEEYRSLLDGDDKVQYCSKIAEWVKGILSY